MVLGPTQCRHYCGAKVLQQSRGWKAVSASGAAFGVHTTATAAMSSLEEHDPTFWSSGDSAMLGYYSGLWFRTGCVDGSEEDRAFVCYWSVKTSFRYFSNLCLVDKILGRARCYG
jgi:hypothetical protein